MTRKARARALELHDEARILYFGGRYQEASAKLREAVQLDPEGKLLYYNLGLIAEKSGEHEDALRYYEALLELETSPVERKRIVRDMERVRGAYRHGSWAAHRPVAETPEPDEPERASGVSPWTVVAAVTAGSALLTGGVLGVRALVLDPGADAQTDRETSIDELQSDAREAHDTAIAADVLLIFGAAAGCAAVTLAVTTGSEPDATEPAQTAPQLRVGPAGGSLVWRF